MIKKIWVFWFDAILVTWVKKKKVYAAYPINPTLEHDVSANVSYSYGKQESNLSIKPSRVHYNLLIALFTIQ